MIWNPSGNRSHYLTTFLLMSASALPGQEWCEWCNPRAWTQNASHWLLKSSDKSISAESVNQHLQSIKTALFTVLSISFLDPPPTKDNKHVPHSIRKIIILRLLWAGTFEFSMIVLYLINDQLKNCEGKCSVV